MPLKPSIIALAALLFGANPTLAESVQSVQTGLVEITINDPSGDRNLRGYLWYPTEQSTGQVRAHGNAVWEPIKVIPDAPLPTRPTAPTKPTAATTGQYPLVVLSHGMFGNARNQAWLAQSLTQQGYFVAAIDHPGTSTFQRAPLDQRQLWQRPRDISRTIDHIIEDPEFGPLIDQNRIYMAGHSLGGLTAVWLAGGRYDPAKLDAFCGDNPVELVCNILGDWGIAKTPEDRLTIAQDWSDPRISAFAVFDLGGTQTFSVESLAKIDRPMLVIGAPLDIAGMDLDIESRALAATLPAATTTYIEPASLSHFDFLGLCTQNALAILQDEAPEDMFVCQDGITERRQDHDAVAAQVLDFFSTH